MKLFLAGGFLGSGKTTAIQQACLYLRELNIKAAVITNDQGDQQVDTRFMESNGISSEEVANSCFCCNYPALEKSIQSLTRHNAAEVIFAESVGSCTDLAATIINPLLTLNPGDYDIVLSVFADIRLLVLYLQDSRGLFFEEVTYIYQKQLEEADIIIVNKIDLVTPAQLESARQLIEHKYAGKKVLYQNSLSPESIEVWVDTMLHAFNNPVIRKPLTIDYDTYGRGEARLTWLDKEITITGNSETNVEAAYAIMQKIYTAVTNAGYPIGHLKFFIDTGTVQKKISFTTLNNTPVTAPAGIKAGRVSMLVNARVQAEPPVLSKIVNDTIAETMKEYSCQAEGNKESCFIPGYPKPTHRIAG
ncbi:MAG TPA: GTP-binding protein [Chitinophagaceae bacterium]|nr:GTP-binding protein [Chitinophagaceae bacterium]